MNRIKLHTVVFCAIALIFVEAANASPVEVEFDLAVLTSEPVMLVYGGHTSNGVLDATTDIDGFKFDGIAGNNIRIVLAGHTNRLDPRIELRNAVGDVINSINCSGGSLTCSTSLEQTLEDTGEYFINVSDTGTDESGSYTLHLAQLPPHWSGQGLVLDQTVTESLGHAGDHDFYHFEMKANNQVRISLDGLTNRLDPRVQIWDSAGVLVADKACSNGSLTCSLTQDITAVADDLYTLAIFDSGFDEIGSYNVAVNCLFGSCPVGPAVHVPLPAALPLLMIGLAGIGFRARAHR